MPVSMKLVSILLKLYKKKWTFTVDNLQCIKKQLDKCDESVVILSILLKETEYKMKWRDIGGYQALVQQISHEKTQAQIGNLALCIGEVATNGNSSN
jgi:hypothetical protein